MYSEYEGSESPHSEPQFHVVRFTHEGSRRGEICAAEAGRQIAHRGEGGNTPHQINKKPKTGERKPGSHATFTQNAKPEAGQSRRGRENERREARPTEGRNQDPKKKTNDRCPKEKTKTQPRREGRRESNKRTHARDREEGALNRHKDDNATNGDIEKKEVRDA